MTVTEMITEILTRLNLAETNDFFTTADLTAYLNDGYKDFAGETQCLKKFVLLDINSGTTEYNLPDDCLQVIWAGYDDEALWPTSVNQLDAIDEDWIGREGTPTFFVVELDGFDKLRLYETPNISSTALDDDTTAQTDFEDWSDNLLLFHAYEPDDLTAGQTPDLETCFQWALIYYALWKCFEKEGDFQNLEIATFYQMRYLEKKAEKKKQLTIDQDVTFSGTENLDEAKNIGLLFGLNDGFWYDTYYEWDEMFLPSDGIIYLGMHSKDTTWPDGVLKINRVGDDLAFYIRASSTWTEMFRITA